MSALLTLELPVQSTATDSLDLVLGAAVTKRRRERTWTALPGALNRAHDYFRGARAAAVARARRDGRYEPSQLPRDSIFVESATRGREGWELFGHKRGVAGTWLLAASNIETRRRMYFLGNDGWEPMIFWLNVDGSPIGRDTWRDVFRSANERVESQFARVEMRHRAPTLTSHSLRSCFALWTLVAFHRLIDARLGVGPEAHYDEQRYEAAYDYVRDLLGHAHVATTKKHYLPAMRQLRRAQLLAAPDEDLDVAIERVLGFALSVGGLMSTEDGFVIDPETAEIVSG
jgi:hypothetical protein